MYIQSCFVFSMLMASALLSCNHSAPNRSTQQSIDKVDSLTTWITITKVKQPWYAWNSLVAKKMKKTVPEFKSVNGLLEKNYTIDEVNPVFGGVYHWMNKEAADALFNQQWYDRVRKKYKKEGTVDYYQVIEKKVFIIVEEINQPTYIGISYEPFPKDLKNELVAAISARDQTNRICWILIFLSEMPISNGSFEEVYLSPATIYNAYDQ